MHRFFKSLINKYCKTPPKDQAWNNEYCSFPYEDPNSFLKQ